MRKLMALLFLSLLTLFGCASSTSDTETGGCTEDQALQVLSNVAVKSEDEVAAWNEYVSEQVGFPVELTYMPDAGEEYIQSAYQSDLCYDVWYSSNEMYINEEYAMPLDDIIAGSEVLSDPNVIPENYYEDVKNTYGGEAIYGIPNKYEGNLVLIYRQDWLEEFGMEEPTTLDEWHEYMKMANETYGAYGFSSSMLYDIQPFMSSVGAQYGFVQDENGMWTVPYASDEAAEVYNWLGTLYEEGLYDPNMLTNASSDMRNQFMAGEVAVIGYWDTWVGLFNDQMAETDPNFQAAGAAPVLDENGQGYIRAGKPGVYSINKNTQKTDEAVAFLEFMHSPEGDMLNTAGIPGHDYTVNDDGSITFTEAGTEHGADHGAPIPLTPTYEKSFEEFPLEGAAETSAKVEEYAFIPNTTEGDWLAVEDIINKYAIDSILDPEITGEDAVASMQAEIQPILDEINAQ